MEPRTDDVAHRCGPDEGDASVRRAGFTAFTRQSRLVRADEVFFRSMPTVCGSPITRAMVR